MMAGRYGPLVLDGRRGAGRDRLRALADLLQHHLDPLLELRVVPLDDEVVAVVPLDDPSPLQIVGAELGAGHVAAVDQRRRAADADDAAPGARPDERAEAVFP